MMHYKLLVLLAVLTCLGCSSSSSSESDADAAADVDTGDTAQDGDATDTGDATDSTDAPDVASDMGDGNDTTDMGDDAADSSDGNMQQNPLQLVTLNPLLFPLATCSDGSPGAFHIRYGEGENANKWIIWFEGGGYCADASRCAPRTTDLNTVSSLGLPATRNANGILSANPDQNPQFHDWTHVRLAYCSSDRWSGQRMDSAFDGLFANDPTLPFYFRGRFIVDSIFDTLLDPGASVSLSNATHVVLAGSSGGAHGQRNNIDRLAPRLMINGSDVWGLSDAGIDGYLSPAVDMALAQVYRDVFLAWNAFTDSTCSAAHAGEEYRCLEPGILLAGSHFETPMFFASDQLDPVQMSGLGIDGMDTQAVEAFARGVRDRLAMDATGAFSPRAANHVIVATERFAGPTATLIDGRSLSMVFADWMTGAPAETVLIEAP